MSCGYTGYSNLLSGAAGSIQNYLVYANSLLFMRSGGNSRLAGVELAILTACIMVVGPKIIGFIPVMVVGTLIFDLGFELLLEAIWQPRKKLKLLEYLTVRTTTCWLAQDSAALTLLPPLSLAGYSNCVDYGYLRLCHGHWSWYPARIRIHDIPNIAGIGRPGDLLGRHRQLDG